MKKLTIASAILAAFALPSAAQADKLRVNLVGYQEVPALSTPANAEFEAKIEDDSAIVWKMSYSATNTPILQSHIHFGQKGVNGGVSIFLCSNLGNGPAGTQACPPGPATIQGRAVAADVVGPAGQGIAATELAEILAAIRAGIAYVNLHTQQFPGGEIRGQFRREHGHHGHD